MCRELVSWACSLCWCIALRRWHWQNSALCLELPLMFCWLFPPTHWWSVGVSAHQLTFSPTHTVYTHSILHDDVQQFYAEYTISLNQNVSKCVSVQPTYHKSVIWHEHLNSKVHYCMSCVSYNCTKWYCYYTPLKGSVIKTCSVMPSKMLKIENGSLHLHNCIIFLSFC